MTATICAEAMRTMRCDHRHVALPRPECRATRTAPHPPSAPSPRCGAGRGGYALALRKFVALLPAHGEKVPKADEGVSLEAAQTAKDPSHFAGVAQVGNGSFAVYAAQDDTWADSRRRN